MKHKENILVTIAARGGSKGVKNKNIKMLLGKPLIAHTIKHAKEWGRAADIVCSSDSKKIIAIAKRYGVKVPFVRPKHLSGDKVSKVKVIRHALIKCEELYRKTYDIVVDLDVTAPIRKVSDLDKCLRIFKRKRPKTLFSVVKSHKNPYFNMVEKKKDGTVALSKTFKRLLFARQDAPVVYDVNASIYFYNRDYLINEKDASVIADDSVAYVMDEISGFDINSEMDFRFVKFLMKERIYKND